MLRRAPADEPPLDEFWRQVVLDVVAPDAPLTSEAALDAVGAWLVKHQPISLAINGTSSDADHAAVADGVVQLTLPRRPVRRRRIEVQGS